MKTTVILFLTIFLFNCQSSTNSMDVDHKAGKSFFDYDAIDYYFNNIDEHNPELYSNHNASANDSMRKSVIMGFTPENMSDLSFIGKLEAFGYSKHSIHLSKFKAINGIFSERAPGQAILSGCIYIYRDILIFKKEGEVIGIAKICFACGDAQLQGTTAYTGMFGQNGDYGRLKKLLKK